MTTDTLAPLRRFLLPPCPSADDATRLHAAVELMKRVRPVDRTAEAYFLAGDEGSAVSHPMDVLHRLHLWMMAAQLAFIGDALDLTRSTAETRLLHAEAEAIHANALHLLREQRLVVASFIPAIAATDCPETVQVASRSEPGHPPVSGQPIPVRVRHRTRRRA